jgi:hypothetical protein
MRPTYAFKSLAALASFVTLLQNRLVSSAFTNRHCVADRIYNSDIHIQRPHSPRRREYCGNHIIYMSKGDPFASGSELLNIRNKVSSLKEELRRCLESDDIFRAISLRESIRQQEKKDPELAYMRALEKMKKAQRSNRMSKYARIAKYTEKALTARQYITRFNLNGLWIGT